MTTEIINELKSKMEKSIESLVREFAAIRAGHANANLLERVSVNYYGADTPVQQLAGISVPEPRMLLVTPYDKSSIDDILKAINMANLGVNPTSDGNVIRITVPALTEERRKELVKEAKKEAENAKVAIRNIRRDANDALKKAEKNGELTEDDLKSFTDDVQTETDNHIKKIDALTAEKESSILEV
ncbi:ribosome recycling factor [Macrococcoides bohemicum]|uniref:Ribosome-recycling factor n=1 Tax=Macrococcoides bohemicum TaxID=1903056 RepID=A0A4R5XYK5_9STAP|nr:MULTISPECIES: ribosome recycling factor [Macrococcus]ATD30569.1 ribosome recycling factor [Macrococcus sp. IME1552]MBC9875145.1 ribosome recycling factor [Macrococcus bohemicus]QRN49713.1 ribosome recycling factor [Macrococcus bohemicus]QYA43432.1 ribosome recycling factor [Macrococcus bohemicus]QYA45830.1 ribosome recycling factor [Macrococcus bohemicus]